MDTSASTVIQRNKITNAGISRANFVQVGQEVHAGDNLLSLEGYENGEHHQGPRYRNYQANFSDKGQSVNKGQLLITFA